MVCKNRLPLARSLPAFAGQASLKQLIKVVIHNAVFRATCSKGTFSQKHFASSKTDDAPRIRAIYLFLCSHSISNNKSLIGWIVTRRFASLTCCTRNFLCNLENMLRVAAKSRSPLNVFFITSNTTKNQKRNRRLPNMEASQPRVPDMSSAARSRICSC